MIELSAAERDNLLRWRRRPAGTQGPGHVESHFLVWRLPRDAPEPSAPWRAFWLRYVLFEPSEGRGPPVAEVWLTAFDARDGAHRTGHARYVGEGWHCEDDTFYLRMGDNEIRHGGASGKLDVGGEEARWDLRWTVRPMGVRHLPWGWMYSDGVGFPRSKMTTPQPDAQVYGSVEIGGQRIEFEKAPGLQGHNWGRGHAERWAWASASDLAGRGRAVLEAVSGRLALGGLRTPALTAVYLEHDGEPFLLRGPRTLLGSRSTVDDTTWVLQSQGAGLRIEATFSAPRDAFVAARYRDPSGPLRHVLHTGLADATLHIHRRAGARYDLVDTLRTEGRASLELGTDRHDGSTPIAFEQGAIGQQASP